MVHDTHTRRRRRRLAVIVAAILLQIVKMKKKPDYSAALTSFVLHHKGCPCH